MFCIVWYSSLNTVTVTSDWLLASIAVLSHFELAFCWYFLKSQLFGFSLSSSCSSVLPVLQFRMNVSSRVPFSLVKQSWVVGLFWVFFLFSLEFSEVTENEIWNLEMSLKNESHFTLKAGLMYIFHSIRLCLTLVVCKSIVFSVFIFQFWNSVQLLFHHLLRRLYPLKCLFPLSEFSWLHFSGSILGSINLLLSFTSTMLSWLL